MNNFSVELPLGTTVSFGQVSVNILLEMYRRNLQPNIFPFPDVRNFDLSAFNLDKDFLFWLDANIKKAPKYHSRKDPCFRLWHLNGSLNRLSDKQVLFTFYECNKPTIEELNIVNNNDKVLFSSHYSNNIFKEVGCENTGVCHIGFDSNSFFNTNKKYLSDEYTVFFLGGKMEQRKNSLRILRLWKKHFSKNRKVVLHCAIYNHFIDVKQQEQMIGQVLDGEKPFNINFLPWMKSNASYNDCLNSCRYDLTGMSLAEGWNLPAFNMTCLGKRSFVLDSHAHKDWATKDNSILLPTNNKIVPMYDNQFFQEGAPFNQGDCLDFNDDVLIAAMESAINNRQPLNEKGIELGKQFTYTKTVDTILKALNE